MRHRRRTRQILARAIVSLPVAVALMLAGLWPGQAPAGALPAPPAACSFGFGPLSTQGALGTLIFQVAMVPASPGQGCLADVAMTSRITDAAGAVPSGISADGGTAPVSLLFSSGELPAPVVLVGWHSYCTTVAQPVYLHLTGGGKTAVYPLGTSQLCSRAPGPSSTVDPPFVRNPDPAVGLAPVTGGGYRVATTAGSALRQPGAVVEAGDSSVAPFVGIAGDPAGTGFWMVAADGGVYAYNGAPFLGSAFGLHPAQPVVGIVATPTGGGYWLVAADGGVFSFGDARFFGSAAGLRLAAPVVGAASTADGAGYWLAAADGGVFAFGDARFFGSAGAVALNAPVVGVAADRATGGYWLAAGDGGVFAFNAAFFGSAGGSRLAAPVVGLAATQSSGGYWLAGADGGVFTYGDAAFSGSGRTVVSP